jgi:hypothetical protein
MIGESQQMMRKSNYLGILESFMPASENGLNGQGFRLNIAGSIF